MTAKGTGGDAELVATIELAAEDYHALKAKLEQSRQRLYTALREGRDANMTFTQLRDASGLAIGSIQKVVG